MSSLDFEHDDVDELDEVDGQDEKVFDALVSTLILMIARGEAYAKSTSSRR